jgi:FkbM family methyltransferase
MTDASNPATIDRYERALWTLRLLGLRGVAYAALGKALKRSFRMRLRHPLARHPFVVRCPSSDIPTYEQIFLTQEYDFHVRRPPRVIIDAGANIGLASIYFASRFPEARIIAIEPEDTNVELLRLNTRAYPNVTVFQGALWGRDEPLHVVDRKFGKWGFMTEAAAGPQPTGGTITQVTRGISVPTLLDEHGIQEIDIFKIDIEGSEKELFEDSGAWIGRTNALIVELHDRMKPGCEESFAAATGDFDDAWRRGENEFRTRRAGCIAPADNA